MKRGTQGMFGLVAAVAALMVLVALRSASGQAAGGASVPALALAITTDEVDWARCESYGDGKVVGPAPRPALEALLGLSPWPAGGAAWSTGALAGEVRHFRIAFTRPVAIGTICTDFAGNMATVAFLKPEATFPGDLADESAWTTLSGWRVKTLPPGFATRALRFTHRSINQAWENHKRDSRMGRALLLKGRAYAPSEHAGSTWAAAGKETQLTLYWPTELPLAGLAAMPAPTEPVTLAALDAKAEQHPISAPQEQWVKVGVAPAPAQIGLLAFPSPVLTRSLRLRGVTLRVSAGGQFEPLWLPLVALGDDQPVPGSFQSPAPFKFAYEMPYDGFPSIRVKDEQGREVRRLTAEVLHAKGGVNEAWDLKDDDGRYVKPGKYTWFGLTRPPLKLTYENTVYNAGQPPWLAPVKTLGWWMADHCPPQSICAAGDFVFMGAMGAEYGVPLIATDLEGNKVWHDWHQGAPRLCSDGKYAYVVTDGEVIRIDPAKGFASSVIHQFGYSDLVPGHGAHGEISDGSGAAVFGNKLYVTYNAPDPPVIRSTIGAGDINFGASFPLVINAKVHDTDLTPHEHWTSALQASNSSMQAALGRDVALRGELAHTVLVRLHRAVSVGSILRQPGDYEIYALREGQALPKWLTAAKAPDAAGSIEAPDAGLSIDPEGELDGRFDPKAWVRLAAPSNARPSVASAEKGLYTTALAFVGRKFAGFEYALALDRRYRDAAADAKVVPLEGRATTQGGWQTGRDGSRPISAADPCKAGIVWEKPVTLRGFALITPMKMAGTSIDVWDGPADATIDAAAIKADANWKPVVQQHQVRNDMKWSWHSPRMITGDLGAPRPVRAFRVRVTDSPAMDQPASGGFDGFVAFEPTGNDVAFKPSLAQRVTALDLPAEGQARVTGVKHAALASPGTLAFDAAGNMLVASGKQIVKIEAAKLASDSFGNERLEGKVLVPREACKGSRGMVVDEKGLLYVVDAASETVKVFNSIDGTPVRTVGTPGGMAIGAYDPTKLVNPTTIALDRAGKLWVVESMFQPKRISRWSRDGAFEKDFMGPTNYGGGGLLDPHDPTVINHLGMKFRINPADKSWKLEARLSGLGWRGLYPPDRVTYLNGKRYLVGEGKMVLQHFGQVPWIAEEVDGVARPLVVACLLRDWANFGDNAETLKKFADKDAAKTSVLWVDLNRDGRPQPDEVQVIDSDVFGHLAGIGEDLSLNYRGDATGYKLRPASIRPDGLPLYDVKQIQPIAGLDEGCLVSPEGWTFVKGNHMIDPSGKLAWSYPDYYGSVQMSSKVPWGFVDRPPGVLAGGLMTSGTFKVGGETLFTVNANQGEVFCFTQDGLLIGTVMGGPTGYGKRYFAMPECEPGKTDLTDLRNTVEGFQAHLSATPEGQVHLVTGKNHITLIRVDGLEKMKRLAGGTLEVTEADLKAAAEWAARKARIAAAMQEPAIAAVPFLGKPPKIDGDVVLDWPAGEGQLIHLVRNDQGQVTTKYTARLAYDAENLYIAGYASSRTSLINRGGDPRDIFLAGDALDVQLGLDPKADPRRSEPVAGDIRIVLAKANGKPRAVLFRPVAGPTKLGGKSVVYTSPVGQTTIEEVLELSDAKVAVVYDQDHWRIEAAIPWKSIGVKAPGDKVRLHGDLGVLVADPTGQMTLGRYYWANKRNVVLSDQPSEARLLPDQWGEFNFAAPMASDQDFLGGPDKDLLKME